MSRYFCSSPACEGLPWAESEWPHPCLPAYLRENPDGSVSLLLSRRDADRAALAERADPERFRWCLSLFNMQGLKLRAMAHRGERLRLYANLDERIRGEVVTRHWIAEFQWAVRGFSSYFRNRPQRRGGPHYERREYVGA